MPAFPIALRLFRIFYACILPRRRLRTPNLKNDSGELGRFFRTALLCFPGAVITLPAPPF
ncbi:hypothetical protein CSZ94_06685 [Janthinobacterium sp. ROICE36]|uniref:hypothetical protein n=1 Tax=Janthinobacterium sp. ROICE36 TaxID=2048670 RepID=UPI000C7EEC5C|nr:hypothetical protein [Janthinobacterium sp. ROICE36]PLY44032.1 hypothetical protein CSZ94_06685 [Janthinobacterium sp. ROICE36]